MGKKKKKTCQEKGTNRQWTLLVLTVPVFQFLVHEMWKK